MDLRLPNSIERVLLDEATIQQRVQQMADIISTDYAGLRNEEFLLVGVLKGSFIFMADLARRLTVPHRVDFIALSSYEDSATVSGSVRLIMDTRTDVAGRHVLIVEDIVDTGYTLQYLYRIFGARQPASLRTAVLLSKPEQRKVEVPVDYLGFQIPDVWVVGYGLDFADRFRTLPYIAVLKPEVYS
ncbi:MAG TPA: hypoxanthine phosphoribosyltransferase [Anaerolineae bacterium]|nr:hypoxanthine phosphoribosyltransferase [Anaerolineae bacterium]HQK15354.1 hypoxanthine phosphoribosyltransferase [Anaerolineae bacterium]